MCVILVHAVSFNIFTPTSLMVLSVYYIFDGVECTCTSTLMLVLNVCTLSVY